MVESYLNHVSPDLVQRLRRHTGTADVFAAQRIDEQIMKGLDRKVFLPSGGSLVIDRTEAMTVIDVNTGKYTGTGGNLEETVTRNNLEAAEEIVRQLRLRDLGGIIVIDFIDMVLESNRELVLRRLTECLGRDRTKHQVTEITSLGLVQMTRKRIGQGLLEAFSETCEHCKGRGVILHMEPVVDKKPVHEAIAASASSGSSAGSASSASSAGEAGEPTGRRRGRRGRGGSGTAVAEPVEDTLFEAVPEPDDAVEEPPIWPADASDADWSDGEPVVESLAVAPPAQPWTPPVTKSWVNLGATPPPSDEPGTAPGDAAADHAGNGYGAADGSSGSASDSGNLSTVDAADGLTDGPTYGSADTMTDGSADGPTDGSADGPIDGSADGSADGEPVESEAGGGAGERRRRVSRWRLRP
jgi:ribonuclease E